MRNGIKWRLGAVATVMVAAALFALATAGIAVADGTLVPVAPYDNADECEHCHDVGATHAPVAAARRVDFTVGDFALTDSTPAGVTYQGCKRCHLASFAGGKHPHNAPGMACSGCHTGWTNALPSAVAWHYDTGLSASFNSAASANLGKTDPDALHAIHTQVRWPASKSHAKSRCASCHAIASCVACHDEVGTNRVGGVNHALHATRTPEPGMTTWNAAPWTSGFDPTETDYTVAKAAIPTGDNARCGGVKCHDLASVISTGAPTLQDNELHTAITTVDSVLASNTVVYTPSTVDWGWWRASRFSRSSARLSNKTNASASWTFTGQRVVLVGDRDPYRGIMRVTIDEGKPSVVTTDVELYQETSDQQVEVFDSSKAKITLATGTHTIKVSVTGDKNQFARDYYVLVDQIRAYRVGLAQPTVTCNNCHRHSVVSNNTAAVHTGSALSVVHVASAQTGNYVAGGQTNACTVCHSMRTDEVGEHERADSANPSASCSRCHEVITVRNSALESPPWNYTCSFQSNGTRNSCHIAPLSAGTQYGNVAHASFTADHAWTAVTDPGAALCYDCHTGTLDAIHNNSITTNGTVTNCQTCHGTAKFPRGATGCLSAAPCHQGKTIEGHTYKTTNHTALISANTVVDGVGTKLCSACHDLPLSEEHTATITSGNMTCSQCHTTATLGSRTVIKNNWPAPKNCTNCHTTSHTTLGADHIFTIKGGTCDNCHDTGGIASTKFNFADVAAIHTGRSSTETLAAPYGGVRTGCNLCHADVDYGVVGTAGNRTAVFNGLNNVTCDSCHLESDIPGHLNMFNHLATSANSNYVDGDNPTGCAAAGAGCHGTNYDLKTVHPATCSSGKTGLLGNPTRQCHDIDGSGASVLEFASVRSATDDNNECIECHGGELDYYSLATTSTPDRVALNDKWLNGAGTNNSGHYGEATHTASGWTSTVKSNAAGTVTATCENCHPASTTNNGLGMRAQHQNIRVTLPNPDGKLSCMNCHSYSTPVSEVVTTSAFTGACTVCHTGLVLGVVSTDLNYHTATARAVPGGSSGNYGCESAGTNCHGTSGDLHTIHMGNSAPDPTCAGGVGVRACHAFNDLTKQGWATSTTDCDVCHVPGTYATTAHYKTANHQSTTQGVATISLNGQTTNCVSCHPAVTGTTLDLKQSHEATFAYMTPSAITKASIQICLNCHNNTNSTTAITTTWPANKTCITCHDGSGITVMHGRSGEHSATVGTCASSGAGCHNTNDLASTYNAGAGLHIDCATCHTVGGATTWQAATNTNMTYNAANKGCGSGQSCHNSGYADTTHNLTRYGTARDGNDNAKHAATGANGTFNTLACSACHNGTASGLSMEHTATTSLMTGAGANVCVKCHNDSATASGLVKNNWPNRLCADCHNAASTALGAPTAHVSMAATHTAGVTSANCGATGTGCHNTADLGAVGTDRRANNHSTCLRCHDRTAASATWSSAGGVVNLRFNPATKTCGNTGGTCHNVGYSNTTNDSVIHNGRVPGVTGNEAANHAATGDAAGTYQGIACSSCHYGISSNLSMEHTRTSSTVTGANGICRNCHNAYPNIVKGTDGAGTGQWPSRTCGNSTNCHAANWHTNYTADHNFSTETNGCAGTSTGCHAATDLPSLHKNTCADCHSTTKFPQGITATVGGCLAAPCHAGYTTSHIPATAARSMDATHQANATSMTVDMDGLYTNANGDTCLDCHSSGLGRSGDANSAHVNADVTVSTCRGCHNATLPNSAYVITTDSWTPKSCDECHSVYRNGYTNRHDTYTAAGASSEHSATPAGGQKCGNQSGCHGGTGNDLRRLHDGLASSSAVNPGCTAAGVGGTSGTVVGNKCHSLNTRPTLKTCGTGGSCHTNKTDSNHASAAWYPHNAKTAASITTSNLTSISAGSTSTPSGNGCGKCHQDGVAVNNSYILLTKSKDPTGSVEYYSTIHRTNPLIAGKADCEVCHGNARLNGGGTLGGVKTAECSSCHSTFKADYHRSFDGSHTTNTSAYPCTMSTCHSTNIIAAHRSYGVPVVSGITYTSAMTTDTALYASIAAQQIEQATPVMTWSINKSDKNYLTINWNLSCSGASTAAGRIRVKDGGTTIYTGAVKTVNGTGYVAQTESGINISGVGLNRTLTIELYLWCTDNATRFGRTNSAAAHIGTAAYTYTPTDDCDICHNNTGRLKPDGSSDLTSDPVIPTGVGIAAMNAQCETCHPYYEDYHYDHLATAASDGCLNGCHTYAPAIGGVNINTATTTGVYNLWAQHARLPAGRSTTTTTWGDNVTGNGGTLPGCGVGPTGVSCHGNPVLPDSAECADCHGPSGMNDVEQHSAIHSLVPNAAVGYTTTASVDATMGANACVNICHAQRLDYIHGLSTSNAYGGNTYRTTTNVTGSMACGTCHAAPSGTQVYAVNHGTGLVEDGNRELKCSDCHTGKNTWPGSASVVPHTGSPSGTTYTNTTALGVAANLANEFNNTASVGGHRVAPYTNAATQAYSYSATAWQRGTGAGTNFTFNVNTNATEGLAGSNHLLRANVTAGTLKAGGTVLAPTTNMYCADCHGEFVATGPQGAAVPVGMYPGFATDWSTWMPGGWVGVNPIGSTSVICFRCHDMSLDIAGGKGAQSLHRSNGGHDVACTVCHIGVPHAWKRPKLLVRKATAGSSAADPAPYNVRPATQGGLVGFMSAAGTSADAWNSSGNCQTLAGTGTGETNPCTTGHGPATVSP